LLALIESQQHTKDLCSKKKEKKKEKEEEKRKKKKKEKSEAVWTTN